MTIPASDPPLGRRLLCMAYEFCLLFGVTFITGYLFITLAQWRAPLLTWRQAVFDAYMFVVLGVYFGYFWTHGGQTLAMKTWRIRLLAADGALVRWPRALLRYLLCWWGLLPGAAVFALTQSSLASAAVFAVCWLVSLLWIFFDRDSQTLYDRLANTRLRRA